MHFDDAIDKNTHEQNKPEIITFYNSTKSGVDVVDKLGATYNCARNTRRWTIVILYALMNVAGINSQIIHTANNPLINMKRQDYLKTIARELIDEHLKYRSMLTNVPPSVKRRRQEAAGTSQEHPQQPIEGSRKRCEECQGKDNKTRYYCKNCFKFLCLSHGYIFLWRMQR
ncbi:hypothetical protein NQ314_019290 [Rhamnusium bicolor]|uniref:PiggyBac transposable element-derived protein domain-containing protein n=1 Tax=Rhamnusium bicolor TaxID=1586634 RepID=A0AAV8WNY3_9CUCU|nr:hypothetical protein NQ314_019290 [Rhamnusium bicolor]